MPNNLIDLLFGITIDLSVHRWTLKYDGFSPNYVPSEFTDISDHSREMLLHCSLGQIQSRLDDDKLAQKEFHDKFLAVDKIIKGQLNYMADQKEPLFVGSFRRTVQSFGDLIDIMGSSGVIGALKKVNIAQHRYWRWLDKRGWLDDEGKSREV